MFRKMKGSDGEGVLEAWRRKCVIGFKTRRGYDLQNAGYVINRRYSRGKMSPVCHNFVQNAWKKDFCSNCFKSRDEHTKQDKPADSGKYFATPFQNRSTFFKSKNPTSILKIHPKKKGKRSVKFPEEVCSVIGYGGDDWSDDEEFQMSEETEDDDVFPDTEEEKELQKLTKCNTDFNTVKANLLGDLTNEARKSYTSLLLGKIQTDSEGKKKTLMVSVTPFGQDNAKGNSNKKTHARKPAVIPVTNFITENDSNTFKTNIVLSSFVKTNDTIISSTYEKKEEMREITRESPCTEKSLLDEISETLEQNRKSASDLNFSKKPEVVNEHMKEETNESNEKREENKKNGLVRNSPIVRNQERPKLSLSGRPEFKFCKINIDSTSVDSAVSALSSNTINSSFASDDDSVGGRTDSDNDDSGNFTDSAKITETTTPENPESVEKSVDVIDSIKEVRTVDGQSDSLQSKYSVTSSNPYANKILNMPSIIPKIQPSDLFPIEASRELAGEPDGRADPDESTEAPALPSSPVPSKVDARPSFLHGMITDIQMSRPSIPEKPKLPVKPLSIIKQSTAIKRVTSPAPQQQVIMQLQQALNGSIKTENDEGTLTEELNNEVTEIKDESSDTMYFNKSSLLKQETDISLLNSKRKAPMPPPSPSIDEGAGAKYQRNPSANLKSDSPVVREKEKRERASSITPKTVVSVSNEETPTKSYTVEAIPEPAPRRNISLSHDNLLLDEKRKGKLKFSIKKLLRIGSTKDLDKKELSTATVSKLAIKTEEIYDFAPKPKPRLVIIHPLELNGSSVEVVKTTEIPDSVRRLSHDSESIYSGNSSFSDFDSSNSQSPQKVVNKPPPPPRSYSEDGKSNGSPSKPARPPPPKSVALQKKQKLQTWASSPTSRPDSNIYANLGEVRSAIAPRKPERTASMREREAQLELPKRRVALADEKDDDDTIPGEIVEATNAQVIHNYDDVYQSNKYDSAEDNNCDSAKNSDSDYEYVNHARSSSPECDSGIKKTEDSPDRLNYEVKEISFRKSPEMTNGDYVKFSNGMFNRSSSLPYCGSETESEIYSPYSFYSSTDMEGSGCNDDYGADVNSKNTTSKLRVRKGRSVVHKNLEDNYGAVVIANHEALAQVLDQIQQSATMQPSLRGLKAATNLRLSDFTISQAGPNKGHTKCGKRLFYPAVWNSPALGPVAVTLMLSKEQMSSQIVSQQSVQPQSLGLGAVTEFCDLVPLQRFLEDGERMVQATIVVLASCQVDTVQSYGHTLTSEDQHEAQTPEQAHEATFMMLQLINGLKCLQARGIEETPEALTSFVILRESANAGSSGSLGASEDRLSSISAPKTNNYGRLCILQGLSEDINCNKSEEGKQTSLCKCAITALEILLPGDKLTPLLKDLLQDERAVSLSRAKAVLEFALWGPLDVVQGVPVTERELSLQRWLDLERATVLHGLVRTRVQLNAFEQLHLMFLVRSSAKTMCEASVLMEKADIQAV